MLPNWQRCGDGSLRCRRVERLLGRLQRHFAGVHGRHARRPARRSWPRPRCQRGFLWGSSCAIRSHRPRYPNVSCQPASIAPTEAAKERWPTCFGHIDRRTETVQPRSSQKAPFAEKPVRSWDVRAECRIVAVLLQQTHVVDLRQFTQGVQIGFVHVGWVRAAGAVIPLEAAIWSPSRAPGRIAPSLARHRGRWGRCTSRWNSRPTSCGRRRGGSTVPRRLACAHRGRSRRYRPARRPPGPVAPLPMGPPYARRVAQPRPIVGSGAPRYPDGRFRRGPRERVSAARRGRRPTASRALRAAWRQAPRAGRGRSARRGRNARRQPRTGRDRSLP